MRLLDKKYYDPIFDPLRGKNVVIVDGVGNTGDLLLYQATREFCKEYDVNYQSVNPLYDDIPLCDTILLFAGGNIGYRPARVIREKVFEKKKSPCWLLPQSVISKEILDCEKMFFREGQSRKIMGCGEIVPDLALGFDFPDVSMTKNGSELFLREGPSAFVDPPYIRDPSKKYLTPKEYWEFAASFQSFSTDMLHFAICGIAMGVDVTLLPTHYHKNKSMYEEWLKELGCLWADSYKKEYSYTKSSGIKIAQRKIFSFLKSNGWNKKNAKTASSVHGIKDKYVNYESEESYYKSLQQYWRTNLNDLYNEFDLSHFSNDEFKLEEIDKIDLIDGYSRYFTTEMLIIESEKMIEKLPPLQGVIGCPRSGMIPASVIACALSIPLYSIHDGSMIKLHSQSKYGGGRMSKFQSNGGKFLVIDDTVFNGSQMRDIQLQFKEKYSNDFLYGCVFCRPDSRNYVDIYHKLLTPPHVLEWNFDADISINGIFDMDGVLCQEVPIEIDNDPIRYEEYIKSIPPIKKFIPTLYECRAICTGRLEKYRSITEEWLHRHGVKYKELIMFSGTKEERDSHHDEIVGNYKAESFKKNGKANYFIESSDQQSRIISNRLGLEGIFGYVICPTSQKIYHNIKE